MAAYETINGVEGFRAAIDQNGCVTRDHRIYCAFDEMPGTVCGKICPRETKVIFIRKDQESEYLSWQLTRS